MSRRPNPMNYNEDMFEYDERPAKPFAKLIALYNKAFIEQQPDALIVAAVIWIALSCLIGGILAVAVRFL